MNHNNIQRLRRERKNIVGEEILTGLPESRPELDALLQKKIKSFEIDGFEWALSWTEIFSYKELVALVHRGNDLEKEDDFFISGQAGRDIKKYFQAIPSLKSRKDDIGIAWRRGFVAGLKVVLSEVEGDGYCDD